MKYIIVLLIFSISVNAKTNCQITNSSNEILEEEIITTDVPNHLKGAKIIIKLANGNQSEVPAELFKVVPRKKQRLIKKIKNNTITTCVEEEKKNRISILAGHGPREGMNKKISSQEAIFETNVGFVGGVQYQKVIKGNLSIGGQMQTNKTGSLVIGWDF